MAEKEIEVTLYNMDEVLPNIDLDNYVSPYENRVPRKKGRPQLYTPEQLREVKAKNALNYYYKKRDTIAEKKQEYYFKNRDKILERRKMYYHEKVSKAKEEKKVKEPETQ